MFVWTVNKSVLMSFVASVWACFTRKFCKDRFCFFPSKVTILHLCGKFVDRIGFWQFMRI